MAKRKVFNAERFVEACARRGLNVTEVAAAVGAREATVTNWFDGTNAPGGVYALQLPDLLGVEARDLLREKEVVEQVA